MKKIVERYCFKCLVIFLIILAACIPIVAAAYRTIEQQVIDTAELRLQEGIQKIDHHLEQMIQIAQNVKSDEHFEIINRTAGELPADRYLDLAWANQYLKDIGIGTSFSPYIFALFKKNDVLISSAQCSGDFSDSYYGTLFTIQDDGKRYTAEEIRARILGQESLYSFWGTDQTEFWSENSMRTVKQAILCLVRGNGKNSLKASYVMGFLLDPTKIVEEILMGQMGADSIVRIMDAAGETLLYQGEGSEIPADMAEGTIQMKTGTYQVISQTAKEMGWKVQIGVPQEMITGQVKDLIRLILLYVAVGILLLLAAVLTLLYRQYISVRKLLLLCPEKKEEWKKNKNEYEILASVMTKMRENEDQFRESLEQITRQNQTILMENFIVRGIASKEERRILAQRWHPFPEFYCAALMQAQEGGQTWQLAALFVEKALKETQEKRVISIPMGEGEELFVLEMFPEEKPSTKPVLELLDRISRLLLHERGVAVQIGVSSIATKMENLPVCYQQARQILTAYYQENQRMVEGYCYDWKRIGNQMAGLSWLQKMQVLISCGERETVAKQMER